MQARATKSKEARTIKDFQSKLVVPLEMGALLQLTLKYPYRTHCRPRVWDDQNENFERTLVLAVADDDDGFSSRRRQQRRQKGARRCHHSSSRNQRYVPLS